MQLDPRLLPIHVLIDDYMQPLDDELALYLRSERLPRQVLHSGSPVGTIAAHEIGSDPGRVAEALRSLTELLGEGWKRITSLVIAHHFSGLSRGCRRS